MSEEQQIREFLADSLEIESVSYVATLGGKISEMPTSWNVARVPGFVHEGLPKGSSSCDYRWGILKDKTDFWGTVELWWPNGQTRKLRFNLRNNIRIFPKLLAEDASAHGLVEWGITATPTGEIPKVITGIQIDANDDLFLALASIKKEDLPD